MTTEGLQSKTELSQRQIDYDINLINNWLGSNGYNEVIKDSNGYYQFWNDVNKVLTDLRKENMDYIFNKVERIRIIYLYLYLNFEPISLYHLIELTGASRSTVNDDLNKLKSKLDNFNLAINYSRSDGYQLVGKEESIQYVMMLLVIKTILIDGEDFIFETILPDKEKKMMVEYERSLGKLIEEYNLSITPNNFKIIKYIFTLHYIRNVDEEKINQTIFKDTITSLDEYQVSKRTLTNVDITDENQIIFLTSLLLSYSTGDIKIRTDEYFIINDLVKRILSKLKHSYAINLENRNVLNQLYSHVRPALFRVDFQYPMINPIKNDIIIQYHSIYIIIKDIFKEISSDFRYGISDDELAYLTIHFATFLSRNTKENKFNTLRAVIVCPSGMGISVLLYQQLSELFPNIHFLDSKSISELNKVIDQIDLVFSTVLFETKKALFLVNPIMNNIEKGDLVTRVNQYFLNTETNNNLGLQKLVHIIEKSAEIKDRKTLIKDITHLLSSNFNLNFRRNNPLLSEIVDEEIIQLNVSATDWKEVIRKSAEPMVKTGKITENYVEAMITNTEESGPYIVITKQVALPHARPEDGALEVALGITILKNPVEFGHEDNDPIKYIFSLSAVDNNTHLEALSELVNLLDDQQFYETLDNAESPSEILNYIKNKENK